MSVATLSETRVFERGLEYSRDAVVPGIKENAFDHKPLISCLAGRLNSKMFGAQGMSGKGKRMQTGGTTIQGIVNLGQNTSVTTLSSNFAAVDTTPSDTPRHWRANWKQYVAPVTLSQFEKLANRGDQALGNLVEGETRIAFGSLVDQMNVHAYDNSSVGSRITSLSSLINANNSVEGLDGATYSRWNSRGISARGTAAASVLFTPTTTSFAAAGIQNMRTAWLGCSEGAINPHALFTTHTIFSYYEAALQPQERFSDSRVADGGFQQLLFKTAPIYPDPDCTSGVMYFLNFDDLHLEVMTGADFSPGPFIEDSESMAHVSKIYACVQLTVENRLHQNKITGITA